jgi:endonuclease/exonuclease/phosphatase (EEP) superfamily protein YafD
LLPRTVLAWLVAVPWAAWAAARLLGLERGYPLVPLMAFAPYGIAAAVAAAVLALALRRRLPAVVALAAALALGAGVAPRVHADPGPDAAGPGGAPLRVLTVNARIGQLPAGALVDLVRRERPDVLSLQELTPGLDRRLRAAGLQALLPSAVTVPRPGAGGMGLYARAPLTELRAPATHNPAPAARLARAGGPPVEVYAVHPSAPLDRVRVARWVEDLAALPPATPNGPVRVLAGDFNATLDHAALRRVLATGYEDAADEAGAGLRTTWRSFAMRLLPGVAIDHVIADARCGVRAVKVLPLPGSDHRAVLAELVLPRGRATGP